MFEWLKKNDEGNLVDVLIDYTASKVQLTDLALEIGANKIADVIAKLGFVVVSDDEKEKKHVDYLFNVKPNVNQNATDFWKMVVMKMIKDPDGCLVVNMGKKGLFIADSFNVSDEVINERKYKNITIRVDDNTMQLYKSYKASDVMHFRYTNPRLMRLLKENNALIETTWNAVLNGVKARAPKVKVSVPSSVRLVDENGAILTSNQYAEKIATQLSSEEIKGIVAGGGVDITMIDSQSSLSTTDLENLKNQIFDNVAIAMGIPKNIFYGEVTANASADNAFITYACEVIIEILNDTINGAYIQEANYNSGEKIYVNTYNIKHVDVLESATNIDKLFSDGFSRNEINDFLGLPRIDEEWADEHFITKNYATKESTGEGGEDK